MKKIAVRAGQGAAAVVMMTGLVAAVGASPAEAAGGCPTSGGSGSKTYTLAGKNLGKACFSFGDRKLRASDTYVDGASVYGILNYGTNEARWWDTNGANNGWEASTVVPVPASRNSVTLRTCAWDRDGESGINDWGCSAPLTVSRTTGA
ncbi:hypothetical protein ABFU82_17235 [Nocardioides sp. WV_118_6]